jgi:hypothetical protein
VFVLYLSVPYQVNVNVFLSIGIWGFPWLAIDKRPIGACARHVLETRQNCSAALQFQPFDCSCGAEEFLFFELLLSSSSHRGAKTHSLLIRCQSAVGRSASWAMATLYGELSSEFSYIQRYLQHIHVFLESHDIAQSRPTFPIALALPPPRTNHIRQSTS